MLTEAAVWLNQWLKDHGIQSKKNGSWVLDEKYANNGYTVVRVRSYMDPDETIHKFSHMYRAQKGRIFIYEQLKSAGILPLIEYSGGDG